MRRSERDAEFTAFVEARRQRLVGAAYLLCGDPHRAEDLTQQALMRLYRAWPRVGTRGGEDAYVRRALVSVKIDDWRWRARRPETPVSEHAEHAGDPGATDGASAEDQDALRTALLQLTESQRKVVVLRYWLDLSVEETAADLHVSTGTVKSQCARALARLRVLLAPDFVPTVPGERHD
ncbi:SigE family RNA polymerase sigma factor [Nocardioides sp.]|uniref:SigE family RNA polymerase sigma factor n=1 Tax=Nocardioides sp. TaxID=35761 RepID=UPI001A1C9B75|nr:SigE family RNA polymerase sigma factor [Nocardioides sp.]MBJ7358451.1 SigE family RNA polymerase sigma factor [Nocardioides sp.]